MEGLEYHQKAVVEEWKGYGNPPVSWSMEKGLYFAHLLKNVLTGEMKHRVFVARIIQASALLLTLFAGVMYYHFHRRKYDIFEYSLGFFYLFLIVFFSFSPLTYQYYLLVTLMLAGYLTAIVFNEEITQMSTENISLKNRL